MQNPLNYAYLMSSRNFKLQKYRLYFYQLTQKLLVSKMYTHFFRQLDFSSDPGVAKEDGPKDGPKSCLVVAWFYSCLGFGQNLRLKA